MKPSTFRRIFKAFHYRDFRLMWIGACTSSIGTWMQIVAQGWLIYRLSHSAFLLAMDQFLGGIPIFLFSLIGGVVADRIERRKVLLVSQYIQMASAAILTVLVTNGLTHVWPILCLSFMSGLAQAFGGPAYSALIPTLVDRDDMPNAIALNSIQFNLAVTIGPALAGQALAKLGEKWCFGLNALSFLAPIISLLMIRTRFLPVQTGESMFTSLKEGIKFVRKQGSMEALIVLAFCMTALAMPMRTYIPVFVKDIFHRGPETYGNLLSLMGIGSICGSLLVAGMGNIRHKGRFAISMLICLGAAIAVFSLSKVLSAQLPHADLRGRFHDGSVRHRYLAGAADHDQRNARPGDERLQLRLPRRNAHGEPAVRMAGPDIYRAPGAERQRRPADCDGAVLPAGATAGGNALIGVVVSLIVVVVPFSISLEDSGTAPRWVNCPCGRIALGPPKC